MLRASDGKLKQNSPPVPLPPVAAVNLWAQFWHKPFNCCRLSLLWRLHTWWFLHCGNQSPALPLWSHWIVSLWATLRSAMEVAHSHTGKFCTVSGQQMQKPESLNGPVFLFDIGHWNTAKQISIESAACICSFSECDSENNFNRKCMCDAHFIFVEDVPNPPMFQVQTAHCTTKNCIANHVGAGPNVPMLWLLFWSRTKWKHFPKRIDCKWDWNHAQKEWVSDMLHNIAFENFWPKFQAFDMFGEWIFWCCCWTHVFAPNANVEWKGKICDGSLQCSVFGKAAQLNKDTKIMCWLLQHPGACQQSWQGWSKSKPPLVKLCGCRKSCINKKKKRMTRVLDVRALACAWASCGLIVWGEKTWLARSATKKWKIGVTPNRFLKNWTNPSFILKYLVFWSSNRPCNHSWTWKKGYEKK